VVAIPDISGKHTDQQTRISSTRAIIATPPCSVEPVPGGTEEAVEMAKAEALAPTLFVTVEKQAGDQFERAMQQLLGEKPVLLRILIAGDRSGRRLVQLAARDRYDVLPTDRLTSLDPIGRQCLLPALVPLSKVDV